MATLDLSAGEHSRAHAECVDLINRAAVLLDRHDGDQLMELFTADGEFVPPTHFPGPGVAGRQRIGEAVNARANTMIGRHITSNIVVDLATADEAVATSYWVHFAVRSTIAQELPLPLSDSLRSVGEYRDELARQDGQWRIRRRVAQFVFGGL